MERGDNFNNSPNFLDRTITTWMFAYIVLAIAICFFTPYPNSACCLVSDNSINAGINKGIFYA